MHTRRLIRNTTALTIATIVDTMTTGVYRTVPGVYSLPPKRRWPYSVHKFGDIVEFAYSEMDGRWTRSVWFRDLWVRAKYESNQKIPRSKNRTGPSPGPQSPKIRFQHMPEFNITRPPQRVRNRRKSVNGPSLFKNEGKEWRPRFFYSACTYVPCPLTWKSCAGRAQWAVMHNLIEMPYEHSGSRKSMIAFLGFRRI